MLKVLIVNNFISIAIHIVLSLICIFPFVYIYTGGIERVINIGLASVIYTITIFLLYFWAGKKYLCDTHSILFNSLSVVFLAIIIFMAILIANNTPLHSLILPFEILGTMIHQLLRIPYGAKEEKYVYLVMSILPSLTMLIGLINKKP